MSRYIAEEEYDKGSEGDDESGDDDDQDQGMGQEEESEDEEEEESSSDEEEEDGNDDGTLCSHERERARILRVAHSELTNLVRIVQIFSFSCPVCPNLNYIHVSHNIVILFILDAFQYRREPPSDVQSACTLSAVPPSSPASTPFVTIASPIPSAPTATLPRRRRTSRPRVLKSPTPTSVPRAKSK